MLAVLRRIVQDLGATQDVSEALLLLVARIRQTMGTDVASVYVEDERNGGYVLMATEGLRPESVGQVRLQRGQGLVGLVAERAEPVNLADAASHPSYFYVAAVGEAPFKGFLGVPVALRRRVLGVLVVQDRRTRAFTEEEVSFLVTLAAQLAGIVSQIEVSQYLERRRNAASRTVILRGCDGVSGVAMGEAVVVEPPTRLLAVEDRPASDVKAEIDRFDAAVRAELEHLHSLRDILFSSLSSADIALFDAYRLILSGESLTGSVKDRIRRGHWAPAALRDTIANQARIFEDMEDSYLQARAEDIRELGERLLQRMQGDVELSRDYPQRIILVGEQLGVRDLTDVPVDRLCGAVSMRGTASSHAAVVARGMGIPAVFGVENLPVNRVAGCVVVVDGYSARVCIEPGDALRQEYAKLVREERELASHLSNLKNLPAETTDGHRVPLYANSALFADIAAARHSGAEGIGLYRSEMHFAVRDRFPGEEEQTAIYAQVLRAFAPRPVTLRTLDMGADKPLPYFPIEENNPCLGWRGIRVCLDHPELFMTQLRAMLRAGHEAQPYQLLLPMVSRLSEVQETRAMLERAMAELDEQQLPYGRPALGVMVEVPGILNQIPAYAAQVDFFSIGTNDLCQYLLAVDRTNEREAHLYDGLHPAVLKAVGGVVQDAHAAGRSVGVCGDLAGDPIGALLLVGLGVDSLSMSHSSILKIKWAIRSFSLERLRDMGSEAMSFREPEEVRHRMNDYLEGAGLGGLVRAGR
jgi:phosphotransferase system enzyme I (PtsP)